MRRLLICISMLIITLTVLLSGCSSVDSKQQLKDYQVENERLKQENEKLKQENAELSKFGDRFSFSLTKIENTLYNLRNEGYLPLVGSQVNAPELLGALRDIKNIAIETSNNELVLSMMPQEWSDDFNTILIVYDVYQPVLNMSSENAGTVATMAGIFKKSEGKWELDKFTREFKGDESFTVKGM
jgi:hypothetical protein